MSERSDIESIRVDELQCRRLARSFDAITSRVEWFAPRPRDVESAREADAWCLLVAICQQTRTVRGTVGGRDLRGSDWLVHRAMAGVAADPERFTPAAVRGWTGADLCAFFADDARPESSPLDRIDERVRLLRGVGDLLCTDYGGSLANLVSAADRRIAGPHGIAERLAKTAAYADPARKKTWLLLLTLQRLGLPDPHGLRDPESIGLPVDYHVLRVLLRSGAVVVEDPRLRARLVAGAPVTEAEDVALRTVASRVGPLLARAAGKDLFTIDGLLWMIGRNCCHYEHPPVCREPKPCAHRAGCSLVASTDYACRDLCPLEGTCRGSRDAEYAELRETAVETGTHWY
jgi:hypothetical protein